jgi:hypothetical protein
MKRRKPPVLTPGEEGVRGSADRKSSGEEVWSAPHIITVRVYPQGQVQVEAGSLASVVLGQLPDLLMGQPLNITVIKLGLFIIVPFC